VLQMRERNKMLGISIPYLICFPHVESHRVAGLLGLRRR
jgi:hypothetical protein